MGELYSFEMNENQRQGCWNRRTCLEKSFIVLNSFLFIALGALAVVAYLLFTFPPIVDQPHAAPLSSPNGTFASNSGDDAVVPCLTPGCVRAAATMLSYLDSAVEPCDDFYQFACGSFLRDTSIPDDKPAIDVFSEINDKVVSQIRTLIAEPVDASESRPVSLAKRLYAACLNQTRIEERGLQPTLLLAAEFGGWPVLAGDRWDEAGDWSWVDTLKLFSANGIDTGLLVYMSVETNLFDSSMRTIELDQCSLGIDREYLVKGLNDTIVQAYSKYMLDVAVVLGAKNRTRAEIELKDALEFEIELATIGLPNEDRRNATALHNPMQLHEIQATYPFVDWLNYINALLPDRTQIDANETIVVNVPTYMAQLTAVLERTPKRTVANYLLWRAIEMTNGFAADALSDLQHEFEREQTGQVEKTARWEECIFKTVEAVPISLAALYVRKHFQETAKHAAVQMTHSIRAAFQRTLRTVPWMDEETRVAALVKLEAMVAHIGYPDELDDDRVLSAYYRELEVDANAYMESMLRVNRFQQDYDLGQLRLAVNKTDWVKHANVVSPSARYLPNQNSIALTAGILQGRFFTAERPAYLNYGAVGFVIGHEMTHGFDNKGRQFDALGNAHVWWQPETADRFVARTECIIQQAGNFTEKTTNLTLNGIRTLGENIADSGGVKIAYNAYVDWSRQNGGERLLPALPYTAQQLFWISAAQNWCSVNKEESLRSIITTDEHSPGVFRVLGPLRNSEAFARDFGCAAGTPMNPTVKCGMW